MINKPLAREHISRFLKGAIVGLIIVLPGMSGGTLIVGLSQLSATSAKQKTTRYAGGRQ